MAATDSRTAAAAAVGENESAAAASAAPRMRCSIDGCKMKALTRCVAALSRLSDVLSIDIKPEGLELSSVNASRTTFGHATLSLGFFAAYKLNEAAHNESSTQAASTSLSPPHGTGAKRKFGHMHTVQKRKKRHSVAVGMRNALVAFRPSATSSLESCELELDGAGEFVKVVLRHGRGYSRQYILPLITSARSVRALADKSTCVNAAVLPAGHAWRVCNSFGGGVQEILLCAGRNSCKMKNFLAPDKDVSKRTLKTAVDVVRSEFFKYTVSQPCEIGFTFKEFRAIVDCAHSLETSLSLYFDTPGRPIIAAIENDPSYELEFLMATLADPEPHDYDEQPAVAVAPREHNRQQTEADQRQVPDDEANVEAASKSQIACSAEPAVADQQAAKPAEEAPQPEVHDAPVAEQVPPDQCIRENVPPEEAARADTAQSLPMAEQARKSASETATDSVFRPTFRDYFLGVGVPTQQSISMDYHVSADVTLKAKRRAVAMESTRMQVNDSVDEQHGAK